MSEHFYNRETQRDRRREIGGWVLLVLISSAGLGWLNRSVLNTDAVAYIQIAKHYVVGDYELALNGYWGPLLSWMISLLIKLGLEPVMSGRMAMIVSSLVFFLGSDALMRRFRVLGHLRGLGSALCTMTASIWSSQNITPDLLVAGIVLLAIAEMNHASRSGTLGRAAIAGVLWALAYYAKAIALPWAMLVFGVYASMDWWEQKLIVRRYVLIGIITIVLIAPWVALISVQKGEFTISTSSVAAHALAGPPDIDRYHPSLRKIHEPGEGRITSWENPAELDYATWSPFDSSRYFGHQIRLAGANTLKLLFILTTLFPLWLLVLWAWTRSESLKDIVPAIRAAVPLGFLCLLYLPFYLTANEQRYLYVAVPILWVALTMARCERGSNGTPPKPIERLPVLAFAAAIAALLVSTIAYQFPSRSAGADARQLAIWLETNNHSGSVVGSAMLPGGRAGLYVAYFLGTPWLGDDREAGAEELIESGASLIVLRTGDERVENLGAYPTVIRLTLPNFLSEKFVVFDRR